MAETVSNGKKSKVPPASLSKRLSALERKKSKVLLAGFPTLSAV
jgi:hypothetical protein